MNYESCHIFQHAVAKGKSFLRGTFWDIINIELYPVYSSISLSLPAQTSVGMYKCNIAQHNMFYGMPVVPKLFSLRVPKEKLDIYPGPKSCRFIVSRFTGVNLIMSKTVTF